ncbi:hypothetical protein GCM10009548_94850 [Streptomyces malaysiensis subsp. malaysiensis]|uniref:hypothetical protein n=1 Tax=Streptomyces TaxID=1883 RepID=UPI001E5815D0|nr:hypothetical protein [Streptomyces sp. HNM0561]UHH23878.1 hypothetical protein LUV23_47405 [Streptomyces sp. HNM0561]
MSKASEKSRGAIGAALRNGLDKRGGGAQLPAQAASGTEVELSPRERLHALETRIEASLGEYQHSLRRLQARHRVQVGQLLHEINESGLWELEGHAKFGHYVKARWGWDRSYGYRLIDLALVHRALAPLGPAVLDTMVESHARELAPVVKVNGDEGARNFVEALRLEGDGKKVTAAVIAARREKEGLGLPADQSPIGDRDEDEEEVVDAELVEDDEETAEKVGQTIRTAADTVERALRQLDEALALDTAPFHRAEAAVDLSRIRSAAVRLQRRADGVPGPASA